MEIKLESKSKCKALKKKTFGTKINIVLNNAWVKEEVAMEIMKYLYPHDNESITHQNFQDVANL